MKSIVTLDVHVPRARLAGLYAEPEHNTRWMDDIERMEPISGTPGMAGSTYRLVPKEGDTAFVATVVARNLPSEVRLTLDAPHATVSVKGLFAAVSADTTRLTSEQVFRFKGPLNSVFGFLARLTIARAHRRHMQAFKRFAEADYAARPRPPDSPLLPLL